MKFSNTQSENSGVGNSIMERLDFFGAFFITFAYLGFVGLVFWGKDGLVLAAVLSLIVSGYSDLVSDKLGGMRAFLLSSKHWVFTTSTPKTR